MDNTELCGCGRPVRYMTNSGDACNKYGRCRDVATKTEQISSGLVVSAWMTDREIQYFSAKDSRQDEIRQHPLVRLSDAEAIISQQDERIKELESELEESDAIRDRCAHLLAETAVALKGPEKALHRHGWQDLPEVAAKQSAALKLAREALDTISSSEASNGCILSLRECVDIAEEALAAIDALEGE